ncbi:hypothetical protein [Jiangella endophytica]|uniref:hypothetical protein n=1 Tax=Jiangella endophytica TaxID=1623398 RepID=UPI0013006A7F|nr:hypothetical protein [Jiangella endophytica]
MVFRTLATGAFLVGTPAPGEPGAEPAESPSSPGAADGEREPDAVAGNRPTSR